MEITHKRQSFQYGRYIQVCAISLYIICSSINSSPFCIFSRVFLAFLQKEGVLRASLPSVLPSLIEAPRRCLGTPHLRIRDTSSDFFALSSAFFDWLWRSRSPAERWDLVARSLADPSESWRWCESLRVCIRALQSFACTNQKRHPQVQCAL